MRESRKRNYKQNILRQNHHGLVKATYFHRHSGAGRNLGVGGGWLCSDCYIAGPRIPAKAGMTVLPMRAK